MKMGKLIMYGVIIVALLSFAFVGKGNFSKLSKHVCETKCEEKLENAKELTLMKDPIDIKKEYIVAVDGEVVAKLKGKAFPVFGDVYTLKDPKGNDVLIEEGRKKFPLKKGSLKFDRAGVLLTPDQKETGYVTEEFFSWGTKFHLFDKDKKELGMLKGKAIRLLSQFVIYDKDDKETYDIKKQFRFTQTEYKMTVKDNKHINIKQALILAVAADEENDD